MKANSVSKNEKGGSLAKNSGLDEGCDIRLHRQLKGSTKADRGLTTDSKLHDDEDDVR